MFDIFAFGAYLARLRKKADMTQSELADRLSVTRQAISKYERGDSFPDISILVPLSELFSESLDELISAGTSSQGEQHLLKQIANGEQNVMTDQINDLSGIAPLLKPSVLDKLSKGLHKHGVDITNIMELAEYLSDEATVSLIENADFSALPPDLVRRLAPFLNEPSRMALIESIFDGMLDWLLLRYIPCIHSLIEAAGIEGALPWEALAVLPGYF